MASEEGGVPWENAMSLSWGYVSQLQGRSGATGDGAQDEDRIPLILKSDDYNLWLSRSVTDKVQLQPLLTLPYRGDGNIAVSS